MIKLSVGLPIFNSKQIAWLALESLCNQNGIDFEWELLIAEEQVNAFGEEEIKKYAKRLQAVGCVSIRYQPLNYKITLPQKWALLAQMSSYYSRAFVFCAADDYHDKNKLKDTLNCVNLGYDWVAYKKYIMFDIRTKKCIEFDADSVGWKCGYICGCPTGLLRNLPISYINKGVDRWLFDCVKPTNGIYMEMTDGFTTDGLNNISHERKKNFSNPKTPFFKTEKTIKGILNNDNYKRLNSLL